MHSTALALDFLLHVDIGLAFFKGIFRCSLILTSDPMCIYFFTNFICKKMHWGRIGMLFLMQVRSKRLTFLDFFKIHVIFSFGILLGS